MTDRCGYCHAGYTCRVIVIAVGGGLVVALLATLCLCCCCFRCERRTKRKAVAPETKPAVSRQTCTSLLS